MPKDAPRETHRAFTVRVPVSLYQEMGDIALSDGMNLNHKVNQLLRLGLDKHIELDAAIARLIKRSAIDE